MDVYLEHFTAEQIAKAAKVKAVFFDVDGVLTDGGIIYDNLGNELKRFNAKDGLIIRYLKAEGLITGAITGRDSPVVRNRCEELGLDFHFHGIKDKKAKSEEALATYSLQYEEVAYIGDDIIDLGLIKACGLGAVPQDAISYIKPHADLVTAKKGGEGALRELGDLVLAAKGLLGGIVNNQIN